MRMAAVAGLGFLLGFAFFGFSQVRSSASSFASSEEPARVTIGTFTFEQGERLALEVVREEPCPCMCDGLLVQGFRVSDAEGNVIFADEATSYPVPAEDWTGRWDLVDGSGVPVPEGNYTAVVATAIGEFRAELQVVAPGTALLGGRSLARASVCGISLTVYKLVDETGNGGRVTLRVGEKLMIVLPGNPTTGYEWAATEELVFLTRLGGAAYRPGSGLIGGGGIFYFRYEAKEPGEGQLSFAYRRPWESGPPEKTFSITVIAR